MKSPEAYAEQFNLAQRMVADTNLRQRMSIMSTRLTDLENIKAGGQKYVEQRDAIISAVWKECGMNFSMLTPYFFPRYPKGKPMSMLDRPFNMTLMFLLPHWLFVLRGSRQIGKSTSLGTRIRMISELVNRFRTIYVAPHSEPLKTFARKFDEINRGFRNPVSDAHKFKQNMYYRKYPNESEVDLVRVQTSATTVRGKSGDELDLDEAQLLDPNLETELLEVLNDSEIKSMLYTGTSTTFDTLLEARYQEGTQATWHVQLEGDRTIDCGDPEQVIPTIGEYFMIDPKTKERVDPMNGFYRINNPAAFADRIFSIHIPQVINPDIANSPLKWNQLHRTLVRDPSKFVQEKLGIPVESASREITETDLKRLCQKEIVGSPEERQRRAVKGYYKLIVSGTDWGGSDYNVLKKTKISNTTHVIAGVSPENQLHILHFRRHGGMDYKTIMNLIANDHQRYRAGGIGTDYGVGETYHELMRSHPTFNNGRHIIFHYTGPRSPVCNVMSGALSGTLNLNRTESITALLLAMTAAEPYILCPDWEESGDYLQDFLNIHRVLSEKEAQGGQRNFLYHRDASKTDDTVHAMNFAFSLVRLVYNQLLVTDTAAQLMLRASVLGSDKATAGSFSPPSTANRMLEEFNKESWADTDFYERYDED